MHATMAEELINPYEICREKIGDKWQILNHEPKKDLIKESKIFSITNRFLDMLKSEMCSKYDDVYTAKTEQEKTDLFERLRAEIKKVDDQLINHS